MMNKIEFNIDNPISKFSNHLNVPFNDRIIFSGPFGTGKTFFLEKFFKDNSNYNTIHLFPVNYSVSSNEDIFELIKYDILLELMNKEIQFNKEHVSHIKTLFNYSLKNLHHLIAPIAYAVPFLGKNAYEMYDKYQKLSIDYFKEHDEQQVNVKEKVEKYLAESTKIKGSIIESDYFTQLVSSLVDQLKIEIKEDKKCETVLIIDDLDRIDPEHIFRILNVLSAHLDKRSETGNKFNFDRIILVFDQQNVHKIFQNRYGSNVDFSGYIDKFYSYKIFDFENSLSITKNILQCLQTIQRPDGNNFLDFHSSSNLFSKNIVYVLSALIMAKKLTLRRLIKILKRPFYRSNYNPKIIGVNHYFNNQNFEIFFLTEFLLSIYGSWVELIEAIESCREFTNEDLSSSLRTRYISFCLVILDVHTHEFKKSEGKTFDHKLSDQIFHYSCQEWHDSGNSFLCNVKKVSTISGEDKDNDYIKYFPVLKDTLKYLRDNELIHLP